jgi:hypothetical protein
MHCKQSYYGTMSYVPAELTGAVDVDLKSVASSFFMRHVVGCGFY